MSEQTPIKIKPNGLPNRFTAGRNWAGGIVEALFDPDLEPGYPWLSWGWIAGLWLVGFLLWGVILQWGSIPFEIHDWAEITAPRMAFLRDAFSNGEIPLHMPDTSALRDATDRFMAIPDVILSPQVIFLAFLDIGPFVLLDVLLLFTIGTAGLLWLRKRYRLSLIAFTVLFLLFNFNGHITTHISVGHLSWGGYFFFPWIIGLILTLLEKEQGWRWVGQLSLLLFLIVLQGSFHHFVWIAIFLGLLGLVHPPRLVVILKALVGASMLSMVRLLPPLLAYSNLDIAYLSGYPTLADVAAGMAILKTPVEALSARTVINPLRWWEYDLYVGLIGSAFVLYFGVACWLKRPNSIRNSRLLALPVLGLFMLSIGRIYELVTFLPFPVLAGERVSSRMIIVPFTMLLVLAAIYFQERLRSTYLAPAARLAGLGLVFILLNDLWQHLRAWRVDVAALAFPPVPIDLARTVVSNRWDPPYFALLLIGATLSLASAIFLVFKSRDRNPAYNP